MWLPPAIIFSGDVLFSFMKNNQKWKKMEHVVLCKRNAVCETNYYAFRLYITPNAVYWAIFQIALRTLQVSYTWKEARYCKCNGCIHFSYREKQCHFYASYCYLGINWVWSNVWFNSFGRWRLFPQLLCVLHVSDKGNTAFLHISKLLAQLISQSSLKHTTQRYSVWNLKCII